MNKKIFTFLAAALFILGFTSCGDDDGKYVSRIPQISDIVFQTWDAKAEKWVDINADQFTSKMRVRAIAKQSVKGVYLNETTYTWDVTWGGQTQDDKITKQYMVVYDKENSDSFVDFTTPKKDLIIDISFKAVFKTSTGKCTCAKSSGNITYSASPTEGRITVHKTIR